MLARTRGAVGRRRFSDTRDGDPHLQDGVVPDLGGMSTISRSKSKPPIASWTASSSGSCIPIHLAASWSELMAANSSAEGSTAMMPLLSA